MTENKATLYYFDGRGRAESIRWMLAAAQVEFDEVFLKSREQYLQYVSQKIFLYEQVPMLEIDGLRLVQSNAILRYIARKYNLYGKTLEEAATIDMFCEGISDGFYPLIGVPFNSEKNREGLQQSIIKKALSRYLPVFENAADVSKSKWIAKTENLSMADVLLFDALLMAEEYEPKILENYGKLKSWFEMMKKQPYVVKFLSSEGKRKPPPDEEYVTCVKQVLGW